MGKRVDKEKKEDKFFYKYKLIAWATIITAIAVYIDSCTNMMDKFGLTPSSINSIQSEKMLFTIPQSNNETDNYEFKIIQDEWFNKQVDCCAIYPCLHNDYTNSGILRDEILNSKSAVEFVLNNAYEKLEMIVKASSSDGHTMTLMIFGDEALLDSYNLKNEEYIEICIDKKIRDINKIQFVALINEKTNFDKSLNHIDIMNAKLYHSIKSN